MAELLDDLLELSRVGRIVNQPEWVDAGLLAQQAAELLQGQLISSNAQLTIKPNQPNIWGDKKRLLEVYQNLIENAIKFAQPSQKPVIEVGTIMNTNEVVCFVKDQGIGILPAYHDKIFGLFDRLDDSIPGTGVGLALLKRIIDLHHGRLWVQSNGITGQGSTFYFSLPIPQNANSAPTPGSADHKTEQVKTI